MRRAYAFLIGWLVITAMTAYAPYRQAGEASVAIIDRSGQSTDHIIDGNQVRLEIRMAGASPSTEKVTFVLAPKNQVIGTCTIPSGANSCQTELFSSLGWYWEGGTQRPQRVVQAMDTGQRVIGQSGTISVTPRPVVMVHGFISSWETWKPYLGPGGFLATLGLQGFAVGDGQVPGQLNTGSITNPAGRTNTIQENAQILGEYIAKVKEKTGAEMVDLVVHSMGGMISRYYIDRVMQERDVAQLIMLGSPMGGSDCSVLPAALGFYLPASLEIRSSYMIGIFNHQITHRRGIHFYDLAGTAILKPYQSPCADVPNDTVVSLGSIKAIPLASSQIDTIHSELTISQAVFEQFVRPLLENPADQFAPAPDSEEAASVSSPLQFKRVYQGHVDPGGSTELTINIEPDIRVASFALYDPTRSTAVSVKGASGKVIELDPQTNGFIRIEDPSSMLYLGYGFENPKPGPWKVTVLATDTTPAGGADFAISVYFVGGAALQVESGILIPRVGEEVNLTANLTLAGQPVEIRQGQAIIRHPDGTMESLDLAPGIKTSVQWKPASPGVYGIDMVIAGQGPDGTSIERTGFLAIEAQANPSKATITTNLAGLVISVLLVAALVVFLLIRLIRVVMHRSR